MGASWHLVIGAALHWASLLYQGVEFFPPLVSPVDGSSVITPISVLVAIGFSLFARHLANPRIRASVAGACVIAGIACLGLTFFAPLPGSPQEHAYVIAFLLLLSINIAIPVLLWSYAFASLDKRTAGRNAAYTALVSFALAMVISLISLQFAGANDRLNILARCISGMVLIKGDIYFSASESKALRDIDGLRVARFYGGRFLLGLAIGTLLVAIPGSAASPWLMAVELVACLGCLQFLNAEKRNLVCEMVPVAPVVLAVLLAFPFSETGSQMLGSLNFLIIWLSWLFVSSFQLSGLKESMHMSGAFLSATEKAALLIGWSIGLYGRNLFVVPAALEVLSFVAVSATLIWATASSLHTVYGRQEEDFADRANRKHADHETRVLAMLRDQFDLTTREAEIALMLSRGYSRPGICSQLGISEGTVRAHSSHIYTKLGIHRRDELILAVQSVEKELA